MKNSEADHQDTQEAPFLSDGGPQRKSEWAYGR